MATGTVKRTSRISEQPKDRLDGYPHCDRPTRGVVRRSEFPAADRLRRALLESTADAAHHANLRRSSVGANQHAQRHRALHLHMSRFIGVNRIRANVADWHGNSA